MKVLVTGSNGYIGRNLVEKLKGEKIQFIEYDVFTGTNILDEQTLHYLSYECDAIIHLAAVSSVVDCQNHPHLAIETNVNGTDIVTNVAKRRNIKVIFSSSMAAKDPVNILGGTKRLAELLVLREDGIVLRFSNVYGGPNFLGQSESVISKFLRAKQRIGEKATVFGDGTQTRDFIHVDDVCSAIIKSLVAKSGIYEVCSGIQTSIKVLAELIGVEYDYHPLREFEVHRVPSEIGMWLPDWRPTISLEEGIRKLKGEEK